MENTPEDILIDISETLISLKVALQAQEKKFYCISPHRYLQDGTVIGGWAGHSKSDPSQ